ncbi:uncharacterized protein LOC129582302 isoform X2 [Paramacrobiotus metropolitanus]|uniref:uncharacterized protein LOC129582302 isoform X2 n=1 Tax=Paramacrobiotus metropolitanus TaxID=2943436 RepID=UPI0024459271|nr:uncharacterized protein LOC129582302 isoform X2 [Paramacrobiotus metropolitanus]
MCRWRNASVVGARLILQMQRARIVDPDKTFPVKAFIRLAVDKPWEWHSGTMVMTNFTGFTDACCFVMVAVDGGGTTKLFVLPKDRVRVPVSTAKPIESLLEKMELRLNLRKLRMWNNIKSLHLINHSKNSLTQKDFCDPCTQEKKYWEHVKKEENDLPVLSSLVDVDIQCLPGEIMKEVFTCIETRIQSRLRSVCSGWNSILTCHPVRRSLIFTGPLAVYYHRYSTAARLHACWSPLIVFSGWWVSHFPKSDSILHGPFLRQIMEKGGHSSAEALILGRVVWSVYPSQAMMTSSSEGLMMNFCESLCLLTAVCQTLIIRDGHVTSVYFNIETYRDFRPPFTNFHLGLNIRDGRFRGRHLTIEDWWNLIGNSCPTLNAPELRSLTDWIDDWLQLDETSTDRWQWNASYDHKKNGAIPIILQEFQRMDPRSGNQHRNVNVDKWKAVSPKLTTLNKLTLHALRTLQLQSRSLNAFSFDVNVEINSISN